MIFADTHILIWLTIGDPRLSSDATETLLAEPALAVSAVTAFEYADLQQRGRLPGAPSFAELVQGLRLQVVDLPASIWTLAATLPPIHGDPVDRMLIAHVIAAAGLLATADSDMRRYQVDLVW
ncbi:MAG: type II toxin-antitoxin system VapC family toxin [Sphingomicrobium sp.]